MAWAAPDPGEFDTGLENQAGLVFSPDEKTAYWAAWNGVWGGDDATTRTIYTSRLEGDRWSSPVIAPFSGAFEDSDPFVSPDGQWVYFVSTRPTDTAGTKSDGDIWRYNTAQPGAPVYLSINSDAPEYSPIITSSGAIYFASAREGGPGQGDLYRAAASEDGFMPAEPLGPAVNSTSGEWNLWVSADEAELLFEASSRPTNISVSGDIYYSRRTPTGWTAAIPVPELNTSGSDLLPRLHPGGESLYLTTAPIGGHAKIRVQDWKPLQQALFSRSK
jgi:hypothetical protein